ASAAGAGVRAGAGAGAGAGAENGAGGAGSGEGSLPSKPWGVEKLQKYVCYVKAECTSVRLTKEAEVVVSRYYQTQRSSDNRSAARTTVRLLESLIRLAQAHARLMRREEVTLQDAVVSVMCVETSLHSSAKLGMDSVMHSDFSLNPDAEFEIHQQIILDRLGLGNLGQQRDRRDGTGAPPPPGPTPSPDQLWADVLSARRSGSGG
ncbi:unnamed protein product, partial [Discosporangium mesarthrocarpum]